MKRLFFSILLTSLVSAHEGHDHSVGVGNVVSSEVTTGPIHNRYVTVPNWGAMPEKKKLGPLHGDLAVDQAGRVYVSMIKNPGIAQFDQNGKFLKFLKGELKGCHSLTTVVEDGREFIWAAQPQQKRAIKIDLEGNLIQTLPNEKTGKVGKKMWKGVTELLVGPDGDLYFFMGYGSKKIHRLKPDGTLVKTYGGAGKGKDQFRACHGAVFDYRYEKPRILVCDRDGRRMIHLTPDLEWIGLYGEAGMRRPADVDIRGEYAVVAEIEGRVILMDRDGITVASLLENPNKKQWATNSVPSEQLHDIWFTAPHGIKFGSQGEIYVTEFNKAGRVIALKPKF